MPDRPVLLKHYLEAHDLAMMASGTGLLEMKDAVEIAKLYPEISDTRHLVECLVGMNLAMRKGAAEVEVASEADYG